MVPRVTQFILISLLLAGCAAQPIGPNPSPDLSQATEATQSPGVSMKSDNPFLSKWPTAFTRNDVKEAALSKVYPLYDKNRSPAQLEPLTFLAQDAVPTNQAVCAERAANRMLFALEEFLHPDYFDKELFFVIGIDSEWLIKNVVSTGAVLPSQQNPDGKSSVSFPDWMRSILQPGMTWGTAEDSVAFFATNANQSCQSVGNVSAHEVFHLVHMSLDDRSLMDVRPGLDPRMAAWFYEGAAEFFSRSIQSFYGETLYNSPVFEREIGGLKAHAPLDAPELLYTYGHAAIEYLVANVGVEPVMDVFRGVGQGMSFAESFEAALGMELEQFYQLFDSLKVM